MPATNGLGATDPSVLDDVALTIRKHVIRMVAGQGQGYLQQGLGATEIFTVLYFDEMDLSPGVSAERDRCFLSTAHNSAVFYATLAERGLIAPEAITHYCQDGEPFEVNVSERVGPAVESTFGSLGQGLSVALGHALYARRHGLTFRNYVVLGDGELQEGQTWEAVMYAAHAELDNVVCIVDRNAMQVDGDTEQVVRLDPIVGKFQAFGWHAMEVNGNSFAEMQAALREARNQQGRPTAIVANTRPGAGVSFLEGIKSHNIRLSRDAADAALADLGG